MAKTPSGYQLILFVLAAVLPFPISRSQSLSDCTSNVKLIGSTYADVRVVCENEYAIYIVYGERKKRLDQTTPATELTLAESGKFKTKFDLDELSAGTQYFYRVMHYRDECQTDCEADEGLKQFVTVATLSTSEPTIDVQTASPTAITTDPSVLTPESTPGFSPGIIISGNNSADISLGRPTDSSITISAYFPCPQGQDCNTHDVYVLYKEIGYSDNAYEHGGFIQAKEGHPPISLVLTDLKASTGYEYLLCDGSEEDSHVNHVLYCNGPYNFSTAKSRGTGFTFTIESDSEIRSHSDSPEMITQTMAAAASWGPDFHFNVGDFNLNDKWDDKYATYEERLAVQLYKRSLYVPHLASVPLFLVRGNHEGENGFNMYNDSAAAYAEGRDMPTTSARARRAVFDQPEPDHFYTGNDEDYPFVGKMNNWYAFEWGDALFVALDFFRHTTTCDYPKNFKGEKDHFCSPSGWDYTLGAAQYSWLGETLENSDANHKFIFIHHLTQPRGGAQDIPYYEWGGYAPAKKTGALEWEFDAMRPGWPKPVHEVLVENGVDIVFHGHDHVWAFEPREEEGIVYQEVPKPNQWAWNTSIGSCQAGEYSNCLPSSGYVKVDVSEGDFRVEYIREVFDPKTGRRDGERSGEVMCGYTVTERPGNTHLVDADVSCYTSKWTSL